jgi:uncharacterized membrane protein YdjX (TVP38/TMEM64 family)
MGGEVGRILPLKRYAWMMAGLLLFFLALFGLAESLQIPLLTDPTPWLKKSGPWAMAIGVGLLVLDVLFPIPSSVIMVANGALFGPYLGALLSLIGCMGASAFGFVLGRTGAPWLRRLVTSQEKAHADALLERYGTLAIIVTRPLPLLAETTVIMAGTSAMKWRSLFLATILGSMPACVLYAIAGATSATYTSGLILFTSVIALAGLFWWVGKKAANRLTQS